MSYIISFTLALFVSALLPALLTGIALRDWKRHRDEHWTEQARRFFAIRKGYDIFPLVMPFTAIVFRLHLWPDIPLVPLLCGVVIGGALSGWPLDNALFPSIKFCDWLRSSFILSLLRLCWIFLVLAFALLMPDQWTWSQVAWAIGFLIASTVLSTGLTYRLLLWLGALRPAAAAITELVHECAKENNTKVKAVWELPTPAGYAAALIVQRALIFSSSMAQNHDKDELISICRHELAHLNESTGQIALRVAQAPLILLPFIFVPTLIGSMGPLGILPPLLILILLSRLFARLSLHLEKRADDAARGDASESPVYARALERLHRHNLIPAVLAKKASRTHPDLYDRMTASGVQPDYQRPAPPKGHWLEFAAQTLNVGTALYWMSFMS